jgi:hypothetical protein
MATSSHIVRRALSRLSILRINQSPTADMEADGVDALNEMISSWGADGVNLDPLMPLPDKYASGIIAMLAMRLAPDYGEAAVVSPQLAREAESGWRGLLAGYIFAPDAVFDSAIRNLPSQRLLGQRGVPFNIASVMPSSTPSYSGFCTLLANSPTTTVETAYCLASSTVTITPYSATAQDEWHSMRPLTSAGDKEFTITHQNNQISDRVFEYLIVGINPRATYIDMSTTAITMDTTALTMDMD